MMKGPWIINGIFLMERFKKGVRFKITRVADKININRVSPGPVALVLWNVIITI
jgi:hypothetical protein